MTSRTNRTAETAGLAEQIGQLEQETSRTNRTVGTVGIAEQIGQLKQ